MVDIVAAIQTSIEVVKKLRELSKKVDNAEFKMLLADLSSELGDAKLEAASLKVDLADLRSKNLELIEKLEARQLGKPSLVEGVYAFSDDPDGRFCTNCFDTRHQRVRVAQQHPPFDVFGKWNCPSCKAHFGQSRV
ncbi:hypothetical protein [Sphingopyxis chilensis]|uniref:hypothetical protein n=1 Tax=Sphingopyxis chilensis TaxID=180400 RepID=UPI002DDD627D|nr:hypothetical protein [Sphingopyxis chilensis]